MNRADMVRNILVLEQFAAEAKRLAGLQRDQLAAEARLELRQHGTAPTWRMPDVASVVLPVSKQAVEVGNAEALLDWVAHRYPEEVEEVTTRRVRPSFITVLTGSMKVADDVVCHPETGEIVPGLAVREGGVPGNLRITAEPGVKAVVATAVAEMLGTAHAAIAAPVVEGEAAPAVDADRKSVV